MGLICCFAGQNWGICWLSQNHIGRFFLGKLFFFLILDTLVTKTFVLLFVVWASLVAQYVVVLQMGCISLCHLREEEFLYLVSARLLVAITYSKRQV